MVGKIGSSVTFATLCERFLSAKEGVYRPSTIGPLNDYLRTQLLPAFGNQQVGRIRTPEIARWFHAYSRLRAGWSQSGIGTLHHHPELGKGSRASTP